jgi:hypothetical protein
MLCWPKGPKPYDGLWGSHWYNAVHASTGFDRLPGLPMELPATLAEIADVAGDFYRQLRRYRLK